MKFCVAIACLLLVAPALAGRELTQSAGNSCAAYGAVSLVVKSGSCKGWAGASCKSHAKANVDIQSSIKALSTTDLCNPIKVKQSATAIAAAIAVVYTEALAKVSCNGQGFGCGFGISRGDAFATAYAEAFSKAVAAAYNGKLSAICVADLKAIAVGFARAAASSSARACVNGKGSAAAFRSNFVAAASIAIAKSISLATAEVCNKPKDESKCNAEVVGSSNTKDIVVPGGTTVVPPPTGSGSANTGGGRSGFAGQVEACTKFEHIDCCFNKDKCRPAKVWAELPINPAGQKLIFPFGSRKPLCFCWN